MTVSQILRVYGKQFTQVTGWYTDGRNGRCAAGVLMSYYGWNGRDFFDIARSLTCTLHLLKNAGLQIDFIAQLNDSGKKFDEIADLLDKAISFTNRSLRPAEYLDRVGKQLDYQCE